MLSKSIRRKYLQQTRRELGEQLYHCRVSANHLQSEIAEQANCSIKTYDKIGSGLKSTVNLGMIAYLVGFYNKKIKIELINIDLETEVESLCPDKKLEV